MKIMSNRVGMNEVVETAVTLFEKSEISVLARKLLMHAVIVHVDVLEINMKL